MNIDLFISTGFALSTIYTLILIFFMTGIMLLSRRRDHKIKPVSVIVAARNEERNIRSLIQSLSAQDYSTDNYEVIIIDDRSEDNTWQILSEESNKYPWLHIYRLTKKDPALVGKKGALKLGIDKAKNDILAFTDADCLPGRKWLTEINSLMTPETDFLCGYSPLISSGGKLHLLKNLERSSIFAITAGSFGLKWDITSVARNQVYRKSRFEMVNGFQGIGNQRSGDDDLLLQKMSPVIRERNFIFAPEANVRSVDKSNIKEEVHLETRRGSKWRLYPLKIKLLTLFVMFYYLFLIFAFSFTVSGSISWLTFIYINLPKVLSEFMLLFIFLAKTKQLKQLLAFPLAEILYIPFYVYFGLRGTFGKYQWKD